MNGIIKKIVLPIVLGISLVVPAWCSYVIPDGSVSTAKLANTSVTAAKLGNLTGAITQADLATRPSPTPTASAGGIATSASSGNFSTNSATFTPVTNLSVTITTTGRPVAVFLTGDGSSNNDSGFGGTGVGVPRIEILRGATQIYDAKITNQSSGFVSAPITALTLDPVAAGTYTYSVQITIGGATNAALQWSVLVAYEI